MMTRVLAALAALLVSIAALASGAAHAPVTIAQDATPAASPVVAGPVNTAILVSATNAPRPVLGSDGMVHLDYDLVVTNAFDGDVTLGEVVVAGPDGAVLHRLAGDDLVAATQPLLGAAPTASIPASGTVAVVMDVVVAADALPPALHHRIGYALAPDAHAAGLIGSLVVEAPVLAVDPTAPTIIGPPLRGAGWLALNDCCHADSVHRYVRLVVDGVRFVKPEMFAVDWVRLEDGELAAGDGSTVEQAYAYGAEVIAVAPGRVVRVRDGMPESEPGAITVPLQTAIDYAGNFVVVEIGDGVFATFEHLRPGSVRVREGDPVDAGQVLGLLGNSGNSTAPHLHFGLIDGPDPSTANALPFAIDAYTLTGTATLDAVTESVTVSGPSVPRQGSQPLDTTVVEFPG